MARSTSSNRRRRRSRALHTLVLGTSLCGLASWVLCGQTVVPFSPVRPTFLSGTSRARQECRAYRVATVLADAGQLAVTIGPRPAGSAGERRAAQYLRWRLRQLGYETQLQEGLPLTPGEGQTCNVIGRRRGEARRPQVLIGAHYDSKARDDCPGANDNASGVAVTLELARLLASADLAYDPVVVFFGGEEQLGARSLVGSSYCAAHPPGGRLPAAMLCVDMVGRGPRTVVTCAGPRGKNFGALSSGVGQRLGLACESRYRLAGSDHVPFALAGVPTAWVQRLPDSANHTRRDTIKRLEPEALEETGRLLARLLLHFDPAYLHRPAVRANCCSNETQVSAIAPDITARRPLETSRGLGEIHGRIVRALGRTGEYAADSLTPGRLAGADTRTHRR